jgi:hypothetical protein
VYVAGIFTMTGGTISGKETRYGGGVCVSGTFTMNGGTISGNSTNENGGGVYVSGGNTGINIFTTSGTGGIIYGSNAPVAQANKAPSEATGHAVYVDGSRPQKRTTTAGEITALDSAKSLVQGGGWE